jgi:hypothetical protein
LRSFGFSGGNGCKRADLNLVQKLIETIKPMTIKMHSTTPTGVRKVGQFQA